MSLIENLRAALNWQTLLAAFFILLPTFLGLYHGATGKLVAASIRLPDPNFTKAVLYMVDHRWYSARAVVLNRLYPDPQKLPAYLKNRSFPVYWGGPVDDRDSVWVLEILPDKKPELSSFDDLAEKDPDILTKIEKDTNRYRVFIGYAGWKAGQFEVEKGAGAWFVASYNPDVFAPDKTWEEMWLDVIRRSEDKRKPIIGERQKF